MIAMSSTRSIRRFSDLILFSCPISLCHISQEVEDSKTLEDTTKHHAERQEHLAKTAEEREEAADAMVEKCEECRRAEDGVVAARCTRCPGYAYGA